MKSLMLSLIAAMLLIAAAAQAQAGSPAYLMLRTPAAVKTPHHAPQGFYPGDGYAVQTQAYSYGWFGVKPRTHASRSFGYYRNYTQWTWE